MNKQLNILVIIGFVILLVFFGIMIERKRDNQDVLNGGQSTSQSELRIAGPWAWKNVEYSNGSGESASDSQQFILAFEDDNRFSSTTDCNNVSGSYTLDGNNLKFENMLSTQMYCEDSQETTYIQVLGDTKSYEINGNLLKLFLNTDNGVANFSNY